MTPVTLFLVTVASIFLVGSLGEAVFKRTNVPDVIWLIVAGIIIGPVSGLATRELLIGIAPYFAALTLVVILFEGGSRINLGELSTTAPRSGLLALLTFTTAVAVVAPISMGLAAVGWLPALWTWQHGLLLGCIVGGSSSIIVMPAMSQANVEHEVANLVNLESAITDALCVVGASALIGIMMGGAEGGSAGLSLARSFGIAVGLGGAAGLLWLIVLRPLASTDHAYPITLSALLLLYVGIERAGGSSALGILAFAVIVGNAKGLGKRLGFAADVELRPDVRGFHSQMAFIIKSFFFTFIGAMMSPPWSLILLGVVLGLVLLVARVPGALLATIGHRFTRAQRKLVIVSLPRGMAAGVLATFPAAAGVPGTDRLPTIVFACVLTTILVFGVGFPLARRGEPARPAVKPGAPGTLGPVAPPIVPPAPASASAAAAKPATPAAPIVASAAGAVTDDDAPDEAAADAAPDPPA